VDCIYTRCATHGSSDLRRGARDNYQSAIITKMVLLSCKSRRAQHQGAWRTCPRSYKCDHTRQLMVKRSQQTRTINTDDLYHTTALPSLLTPCFPPLIGTKSTSPDRQHGKTMSRFTRLTMSETYRNFACLNHVNCTIYSNMLLKHVELLYKTSRCYCITRLTSKSNRCTLCCYTSCSQALQLLQILGAPNN
jgi:hypothetical protein